MEGESSTATLSRTRARHDWQAWARRATSPLLAIVLHAVVAVCVWRLPIVSTPSPVVNAYEPIELDTVYLPESPSSESPMGATTMPHETAARPAQAFASREPSTGTPRAAMGSAGATETETGTSEVGAVLHDRSPDEVAEGPSFVLPPTTDIGIGGVNRFLPKSEAEVEQAAKTRERSDLLRHTGWERDRALGLGPEGPVLTALSDATSQSIAPVRGRAIFVATTNAEGEVESLELLDAEGGRPGWADARRLAMAALAGKKLRVPSSAKRIQMRIEVVSAWKLPSGQDPGTDVSIFHIPIAKGEGKDSAKVSILEPKVRVDYLEVAPGQKIPVPSIQLEIFGTTADPTNIGAKPRRVIHTHLVDSTVM